MGYLDGEVPGLLEPGPAGAHVGDVDPALLDQAGGGVVDPVALALDVGRLGLEGDHADVARARSRTAPGRRRAAACGGSGRRRSSSR